MEILDLPFLTSSAPQNVGEIYICITPWQSMVHPSVNNTPIGYLWRYIIIKIPERYHFRMYLLIQESFSGPRKGESGKRIKTEKEEKSETKGK